MKAKQRTGQRVPGARSQVQAPPVRGRGGPQDLVGNAAMLQHIRRQGRGPVSHAEEGAELPYRSEMEQAFGEDLSDVQAFTGPGAAQASQAIGAEAFALVDQIVFGKETPSKETVAHEVAHVVQQRGTSQRGSQVRPKGASSPNDSAEREADAAAEQVTAGHAVQIQQAPTGEVQGGWLSDTISSAKDTVSDWGESAMDLGSGLVETAGDAIDAGQDAASSAWSAVKDTAATVGAGALSTGSEILEGAGEVLGAAGSGIGDVISTAGEATAGTLGQLVQDPTNVGAVASTALGGVGDVVGAVGGAAGSTWGEITEAADEIYGAASDAASGSLAALDDNIIDPLGEFASGTVAEAGERADDLHEEMASELAEDKRPGTTQGTEIDDAQLYAHGGFMGMADELLADPVWRNFLIQYTPQDYMELVEIQRDYIGQSDAKAAIGWEYELSGNRMLALENNPVVAAYGQWHSWQEQAVSGEVLSTVPVEIDVWLDPDNPGDLSLAHAEHGGTFTTVAEGTVGWTDPTGEIADSLSVDEWSAIYTKLLSVSPEQAFAAERDTVSDSTLDQIASYTAASPETVPVFLDIKSSDSDAQDIGIFVQELEGANVEVTGVGSFSAEQVQGLDNSVQFFHKVDDVAASQDDLADGAQVMFNLGSLLDYQGGQWQYDDKALKDLSDLANSEDPAIAIGGYVQETDLSPDAYLLLADLAADTDLLELGFAYGSVDGTVSTGTSGSGQGSQAVL